MSLYLVGRLQCIKFNKVYECDKKNSYERMYLIDYQIPISLKDTYRYKNCPISGQRVVLNQN